MATDTVMQNDPNDAFAKMTDEEIVLESQQHDNVLAQEYLLHKYCLLYTSPSPRD